MQIDRSAIALFAEVLFRYCDDGGYVSLRTFKDLADGVWRPDLWASPRVANGLGDIIAAAVGLAEAAAGADESVVFCPPVATFKSAAGAAEKDILNGPALSIDCDQSPERAREILENTLGPATVAVVSGGLWANPDTGEVQDKVHLHWRLTEPTRDFADHVKLKEARRLAMILVGADASAVPLVHPLRWPGSVHRKGEPRLAHILNLRADIEVDLDDALENLRQAVAAMPKPEGADPTKGGYIGPNGRQPSRFGPEAEALDIIAAFAVIPNNAQNWKRWADIGIAAWCASGGSEAGYAAWCAWSSKFDGFDPGTTREQWEHFGKYPPSGAIGAGTLFYLAREAWPGWEKPSEIRQRRDNDPGEPPPHLDQPPLPGASPVPGERKHIPPPPRFADWKERLILNDKRKPRILLANAISALRLAPEWDGLLWFDEFHNHAVLRGISPWAATPVDEPWSDLYDNLTTNWMHHQGVFIGRETVGQAVWTVAHDHPFHPVRDYLQACRWDGVPRLDTWTSIYLGVADTEYSSAVGARWLISAVARVKRPGCKADCALVLEGPQGYLKSTVLRVLADPWFTDDLGEFGTKDAAQQLAGVWIVELSELDSYTRSDVARAKSFMSRSTDRFRPPYGTHPIAQPRQGIFGGTCNHNEYLRDETGGRRFWPIGPCTRINIDKLAADRDQLLAEARDRFEAGEHWWLDTPELNATAALEQGARLQPDAWDGLIADYLEDGLTIRHSVTVPEILEHVLELEKDRWDQPTQNRVARCMRKLKWERRQKGPRGDREWRYFRPEEE
jgi:predicted P-loop ATPase